MDDQAGAEIHDHAYELYSLIIFGMLRDEIFEATPSDIDGCYKILQVSYTSGETHLHRIDSTVSLASISDKIYEPGDTHRLSIGSIHRSTAVNALAATVVLTSTKGESVDPGVVFKRGRTFSEPFDRSSLTSFENAEVLAAISG